MEDIFLKKLSSRKLTIINNISIHNNTFVGERGNSSS